MRRIEKPWGHEEIFAHTDRYVGKVLVIEAGKRLSLQYHREKDEAFYLQEGRLRFTSERDGKLLEEDVRPGEARHIPAGHRHRFEALERCVLFEVSTTELDDVVRLDDDFGRAGGAG
ncbi:MAG: cupin domain-containing protein [Acidobacteriota bacterium]